MSAAFKEVWKRQGKTHLAFEVVTDEAQRVIQRLDGSKLYFRRRLILPSAVDDSGQNLICANGQNVRVLATTQKSMEKNQPVRSYANRSLIE